MTRHGHAGVVRHHHPHHRHYYYCSRVSAISSSTASPAPYIIVHPQASVRLGPWSRGQLPLFSPGFDRRSIAPSSRTQVPTTRRGSCGNVIRVSSMSYLSNGLTRETPHRSRKHSCQAPQSRFAGFAPAIETNRRLVAEIKAFMPWHGTVEPLPRRRLACVLERVPDDTLPASGLLSRDGVGLTGKQWAARVG
nr:hypothetical protein CFP56_21099 [Quercus suber]